MIRAVFIFLCASLVTSCSLWNHSDHMSRHNQSLNGDWQLEILEKFPFKKSKYTVEVPGNWHSSGIDHAGIGYYSRHFNIDNFSSPNSPKKSRYWLNFSAVDYAAAVTVNGKLLGRHQGYFSPFMIEVTGAVKARDNQLNVWVNSPNETLAPDWSLNKTLIKGVLNHHDTRPGGAWSDRGQDRNSGGIWGSVELRETGAISIQQVNIIPKITDIDRQKTTGSIKITLNSTYQGEATLKIVLQPVIDKVSSAAPSPPEQHQISIPVTLGQQTINWQLPEASRALWWPWDWGNPSLYQLNVAAFIKNDLSDSSQHAIGFRQFNFDEKAGIFYVNNKPYFIRGTNYIASQWLGDIAEQDYQHDIKLMRQANINSIRVHAHVAGKALYNQADKLGMIIWQDFPLQWGYTDDPVFLQDAVNQTKAMTDMLYNHASIAFWCGQNEPPWDAGWMQYKYKSYDARRNIALTEAVYQQLKMAGDFRIVRKASYTAEHPWLGWYSGHFQDYKNKPNTAIISEFGAQAMPSYPAVLSMNGHDLSWPLSIKAIEKLKYHNYQPHETLHIAKVDQGESLSQFVKNSQEYQRLVTKFAIEQLRLNKSKGVAAIYQFMFTDSWESISWSVLDVERVAKPGYFALQQAYQPMLAILKLNGDSQLAHVSVVISNDSLIDYQNVSMLIRHSGNDGDSDSGGESESDDIWSTTGINVTANSNVTAMDSQLIAGLSGAITILLFDQQGNEISRNEYLPQDL
jgi:beta-mannosidase